MLRAFPEQLVASRPPSQLAAELLVGFDPLARLLGALEGRFGHLAAFCADAHGLPAVGVRWRPEAFAPAPLRVGVAHATLVSAGGGGGLVVPHTAQVVAEMQQMGAGLVEAVVLCG